MGKIKISTSWDDGAFEDLKLVKLLNKFEILSTLYIPIKNKERQVIDKYQIKELSSVPFIEIGSHTYNHTYLTSVPYVEAIEEVRTGREALEDILGKEVDKFCYPGGKFTSQITEGIKDIVSRARTCNIMSIKNERSFNVDTTCHFMYRPSKSYLKQIVLNSPMELKPKLLKWLYKKGTQYELVQIFIDYVTNNRQNFNIHIWGHSWELEEFNLWDELEMTLELLRIVENE